MTAVFDTNIVIDALNGLKVADDEYRRYDKVLISRITWIETMVGAADNEATVRDFLDKYFTVVPVDSAVSEMTVQVRRNERLRLPDAIILATARVHNASLVTRNTKDFDRIRHGVVIPYTC